MRARRGLSTVVGAVFAIIALTSTVTYVSYSMGILDNYNQSVLTKNQQLSDVNKEKFQISSVTVPKNKLNITVVNTGSLPINFTKIWIQNTTSSATTDWVRSYVPTHNFVAPGGVLTNIGQSSGVNINPAYSYNVKLVTSRGNTQQFNVNSVGAVPLNIQFLAVPSTVSSGFKTELLMIVTNNGSNTLANVTPLTPVQVTNPSPTATCSLVQNQSVPPKYDTLAPGSTAIFKWDLSVTGTATGQLCTWTSQLQGGYAKNNANATVTITQISITSTVFAQNTGILTLNYTSFRWADNPDSGGSSWNTGWSPIGGDKVAWSLNVTNNNQTKGGSSTFYISKETLLYTANTGSGNAATMSSYIMAAVYPVNGTMKAYDYKCPGGGHDWCISVPPGGTIRLYFYADHKLGTTTTSSLPAADTPQALTLLIFGKFSSSQGNSGSNYGQLLPYNGIVTTTSP